MVYLYFKYNITVHILRLSGISGPRKNCLINIQSGKKNVLAKTNIYRSRIHISDIVQAIILSIQQPTPGEIYNISDDAPTSTYKVYQFANHLLQHNIRPEGRIIQEKHLCCENNKKVSNKKILTHLGFKLKFPNYKEGLIDCYKFIK